MGNDCTNEFNETKEDIISRLNEARYNLSERAKELVSLLENNDFLEEKFQLSKANTKQYKDIELKYRAFCGAYVMMLFLKFITDEYDAEIMLMSYGFLKGYDDKNKEERYKKYWEHAHTYNTRINNRRKSKTNTINQAQREIIEELAKTLAAIMLRSDSRKLDFAEEVFQKFSGGEVPEQLSLPITNYFHMSEKSGFYKRDSNDIGVRSRDIANKNMFNLANASKLEKLIDELCEPGQGRLFEDVASDIWKELGLDGDFDLAKFEILLIKIIVEPYGKSMDDAMRRDIGLLTFGLLRGYYHTKIGTSYGVRSRYSWYLDHSNYMDLNYPQKSKFEKLKQTEQEEIWEKLYNLGNECKGRVCSRLLDLAKHGDCEIFMNCAITELRKRWLDEDGKLKFKLPKERYTLKRFSSEKRLKRRIKILVSITCLLCIAWVVCSPGISNYNKDDDILNPQKVLERENRDRMGMNAKLPDTYFEDIDSNYTLPNGLDNMTLEELVE